VEDVEPEIWSMVVGRMEDPQTESTVSAADVKDDRVRAQTMLDEHASQFVTDLDQASVVLAHEPEGDGWKRDRATGSRRGLEVGCSHGLGLVDGARLLGD
jgi:hypothetical protein